MKKIGILTFQNAINYGAILQNYALQEYLDSLGYIPQTINYQNKFINRIYSVFPKKGEKNEEKWKKIIRLFIHPFRTILACFKKERFRKFINSNINLSKKCNRNSIKTICKEFDFVLAGSDQIWNGEMSDYDKTYYLDFLDDDEQKISYAASFGKSFFTGYDRELMSKYLPRFHFLSMREQEGADFVSKEFRIPTCVCLDPTLLWNSKFWEKHLKKNKQKSKYLFVYLVQESEKLDNLVEKFANENNLIIVSLSRLKIKKYKFVKDAGIEDFLTLIFFSEYVFSTSFHAIVFSIIFHKRFYYELSRTIPNNNSRIIDLCKRLDLKEREIAFFSKNEKKDIDYSKVDYLLEKLRFLSTTEFRKALEK